MMRTLKPRPMLKLRNIIICRMSLVELRRPLIDDLDNLRGMPIVKMIAAIDELISGVGSCGRDKLLRVFMEKRGFGPADDGEQWAAQSFGVGTAIVAIVLAVLVQVRTRAKDSRCGAHGNG